MIVMPSHPRTRLRPGPLVAAIVVLWTLGTVDVRAHDPGLSVLDVDVRSAALSVSLSIAATDVRADRLQQMARQYGIRAAASNREMVDDSDVVILAVKPQIREGIKVDVSQFASLVRIRGSFAKPAVAIDAAQTAQMIAKLGIIGAQGGGIEALGRALIAPAGDASPVCAIAQSGKAPREAAPASRDQRATPDAGLPKDVAKEVGKALGRLLGR